MFFRFLVGSFCFSFLRTAFLGFLFFSMISSKVVEGPVWVYFFLFFASMTWTKRVYGDM